MTAINNRETVDTVCFTGHRRIENERISEISAMLERTLRILISHGITRFLAGGALGFDTIAALTVLDLKKEFPNIRLELILPCRSQTKFWSDDDRALYQRILKSADSSVFLHDSYTADCMHDRNRRLVDDCDICVAFLEYSGGGTAYTVSYALKCDKPIINIAELI